VWGVGVDCEGSGACKRDRARQSWAQVARKGGAMRVLIACEFSGVVRRAFRSRGHDAWSCDLLPAEDSDPHHYRGSIAAILSAGAAWDLMIAHPPCTYLANSGARWWSGRQREQADALDFVRALMSAPIPRIAIENPPGKIGTAIRPADQYIQPWQFGHAETKKTGLWLKGLAPLKPTRDVRAEMLALPAKERHRVHYTSPGPDRWKERSRTLHGIADAMADQWGRT